ncbi:hypothetical protein VST7929_02599 [Vibrio stylophorae]|uniref:ATP-dependent Lon protease n=1 Tax=Vibrio stylophorae TaxID=659351 RepID=A0ABN8DWG3_9VIBR|nr:ATP-dependent Lon protease [Vibrio stylophorae]CAH0534649.1 hypothetical protein VST7929_02599 [Vibrio stylophorae]
MLLSPSSINVPVLTPTINPPTEQAARDNRTREKIVPPAELAKSKSDSAVTLKEKQRKRQGWDPSEHPEYEQEPVIDERSGVPNPYEKDHALALLQTLLTSGFCDCQDGGYCMTYKFPIKLLEAIDRGNVMAQRRVVIDHHYNYSTSPNVESKMLMIL